MVSRIEFFCPGCGAPEVPELILREYYNCPNCQETIPREKLDRQRRNNYLLAGTFMDWTIQPLAVGVDDAAAGTLTTPSFYYGGGELLLAAVGDTGGFTPVSVKISGNDSMTSSIANPGAMLFWFNGTLTRAGPQNVVVTYSVAPASICCVVFKVTGQIAGTPTDKTAGTATAFNPSFSSTATVALVGGSDLAVGVLGWIPQAGVNEVTVAPGFLRQGRSDAPVGGFSLIAATRPLQGKAAVAFTGTGSSDQNGGTYIASVVTFKHA